MGFGNIIQTSALVGGYFLIQIDARLMSSETVYGPEWGAVSMFIVMKQYVTH